MQKTTHQAPVDAPPRDHDSLDAVDDRPEAAQGGPAEGEVVHGVVVPLARGGVLWNCLYKLIGKPRLRTNGRIFIRFAFFFDHGQACAICILLNVREII